MTTILGFSETEIGIGIGLAALAVTAVGVYYTRKQTKQTPPVGEKHVPIPQSVESQPAPTPPPNIPLATHFVDRPDLIAKVMQAIAPQNAAAGPRTAVISSLQGMGGVGKTELAREVARRMKSQCPGGTAEVNLRGWDSAQPMDEEEALRELCPQLDHTTDPTLPLPSLRAHWRQVTSGRRSLVILDNLKDSGLIDRLRPSDGITLVTSRTSNLVKGVPGIDVGVMQPAEAAALARQNCPKLSEDDARALAEAVGYLPLAVEIAAQRLNDSGESVVALAKRLADPNRTARVLQGDTEQENVLLRVLEWSLEGLSDEQKQRWQALALLPGDFGLWAVQALWLEEDPVDDLAALTRRNLVTKLPGDEPRWRLHDVLRRFGLAALAADGEREQALWRQLGPAAVARLNEISSRFKQGGEAVVPSLLELDQELPLLRMVQSWAKERALIDDIAKKVISKLRTISPISLRLSVEELVSWRESALSVAEQKGNITAISTAAGNLGLAYRRRGDLKLAEDMHQRSLALAKTLGSKIRIAKQTGNLGEVYREYNDLDRALEAYSTAFLLAEECNSRRSVMVQSGNIAEIYRLRGNLERAEEFQLRGISLAEQIGDLAEQSRQYGGLAQIHFLRGDLDQAAEIHGKSLSIAEQLGDRAEQSRQTFNLGNVLKDKGDWAGAAEHFRRSLALAEELGMPLAEGARQALAEAEAHLSGGNA